MYDSYSSLRWATGAALTRMGYTGELIEPDGTLFLRARHYQPELGASQADTYLGDLVRPQSRHRYLYAENNPISRSDPSGHWADAISEECLNIQRDTIKELEYRI